MLTHNWGDLPTEATSKVSRYPAPATPPKLNPVLQKGPHPPCPTGVDTSDQGLEPHIMAGSAGPCACCRSLELGAGTGRNLGAHPHLEGLSWAGRQEAAAQPPWDSLRSPAPGQG